MLFPHVFIPPLTIGAASSKAPVCRDRSLGDSSGGAPGSGVRGSGRGGRHRRGRLRGRRRRRRRGLGGFQRGHRSGDPGHARLSGGHLAAVFLGGDEVFLYHELDIIGKNVW